MTKIPAIIIIDEDGQPDAGRHLEARLLAAGIEIAQQAPTLTELGGKAPVRQQVRFGRAPKSAFTRPLPGITLGYLGAEEPLPGAVQEGGRTGWHTFQTGWMRWEVTYGVRNGQAWWFIAVQDTGGRTVLNEQVRMLYPPDYGPDIADIARLGRQEEMLAQRLNLPWPPDTPESRAAG